MPAVFTAAWLAAALVQTNYSPRREDVSALAARTADHAWIMIAGLVVVGLLAAAFSLALPVVLPGRAAVAGAYLVGLGGFGTVALGLLRNDCSSLRQSCEKRVEAGEVSWEHTVHDVVSVPVFACVALAPAVLALAFRGAHRSRALLAYSALTALAVWVLLALAGLELPARDQGTMQKAAAYAVLAWLEVIAVRVWGLSRPP